MTNPSLGFSGPAKTMKTTGLARSAAQLCAAFALFLSVAASGQPSSLTQTNLVERITFTCDRTNQGTNTVIVHMRNPIYHEAYRFELKGKTAADNRTFFAPGDKRVYPLPVPPGVYDIGIVRLLGLSSQYAGPAQHAFFQAGIVVPPIRPPSLATAGRSGCQFEGPGTPSPVVFQRESVAGPAVKSRSYVCEPNANGAPNTLRIKLTNPLKMANYTFEFRDLATGSTTSVDRFWNEDMVFAVPPGEYELAIVQTLMLSRAGPTLLPIKMPPTASTGGRGTGCRLDWPPGTGP